MSGQPVERRLAKFLGLFSFGLGVTQLAAPERVNQLIGVRDRPKSRAIQRAVGVQELTEAQGIFALSPPTPVLWSRVAGDIVHLAMLGQALGNRRNNRPKLLGAISAVVGITALDTFVSARYQSRWPKEPTQGRPLPTTRDHDHIEAHYDGNPAITILATESEIRPTLHEFGLASDGQVVFRQAPGGRGTEVIVNASARSEKVKADLRRIKQRIETGEIVRSEGAPEGSEAKRQLWQRPAQPLKEKELAKAGGRSS
ncbi:MAG TPA: hypothetical protein VE570_08895 [Thermoleophilaceae bacterium]|nr:hypothetical protein [Thermoleophilaceae bacterium]